MAEPESRPSWTLPLINLPKWIDTLGKGIETLGKGAERILEAVRRLALPWDAQKAADIRDRFRPHEPGSGMGCMAACYDVLSLLYSPQVAQQIRKDVYARALARAREDARRRPEVLKAHIEQIKNEATAKGQVLTDAQARRQALDRMSSPHNTVDHLMGVMQERGHAGEPAALQYDRASGSWSPDPEQAIRQMILPDKPGMYFFGVSVSNGHHTVTLAVERAADGSQKVFWLDQHETGLSNEVTGNLGDELEAVRGSNSSTTRIWALQPPTAGAAP